MPPYEGIATDKHCVILDIGHAYTKCGFAREPGPRFIIPSEIQVSGKSKATKIWDYNNKEELYENLKEFLHILYFRYLVVNPKDRRIVIVESVLCPTEFRETLAKVLFTHFEVPSLLFLPSHLMVIYTLGISSALVVDVGYTETVVLPIFEKVPILNAWEAIPLGAQAIHRRLEAELMDKGKVQGTGKEIQPLGNVLDEPLPESVFEDIKVRTCFVSPLKRSDAIQQFYYSQNFPPSTPMDEKKPLTITPALDVDYPLDGQKMLKISGILREVGPEVLFEQDADGQSIATILLDSVLRCPIDIRKSLCENIVLMGGTAMLTGFQQRFVAEVKKLLASDKYSKRLPIKTIKVHRPPAKCNYVAWLGGAIFGATDAVVARSITKEQYVNKGRINDWSDQEWLDGDVTKVCRKLD